MILAHEWNVSKTKNWLIYWSAKKDTAKRIDINGPTFEVKDFPRELYDQWKYTIVPTELCEWES